MRWVVRWGGKVEVEEWRVRIEILKEGLEVRAERMEGPRLPPAPIRRMFLMDIFGEGLGGGGWEIGD